jgi:hypothetical protein
MNPFANEEMAWIRLQDMQREAENGRLIAGTRRSATMAVLRSLVSRLRLAIRPREIRVDPDASASGEGRQEVA